MKLLCVHQNFPGQYLHLVRHLGATGGHQVVFLTQRADGSLPGVHKIVYRPERGATPGIHPYLRETESALLNAQAVARAALALKHSGFVPDVMLGHNGWGEIWYLKDVFPETPLLGYFEFFYALHGADVGFDQAPLTADDGPRLRTKNLGNLLALDTADAGQCPTHWQRSRYPKRYHDRLHVVHEGIDTAVVAPDAQAWLQLPGLGLTLTAADPVVTYVARNLEPYRGFPSFLRALPAILEQVPAARVVVVGGDEVSYGPPPASGTTYRQQLVTELGDTVDWTRVHFVGKLPYPTYLKVLQVSRAHVYLTYPFVLSWSMLEAMAAGALVIGSRTAPVLEVIEDGVNGRLVDFFDAQEIAQTVVACLTDPKGQRALRAEARRTIVERYDLKSVCLPQYLALIEGLRAGP